MMDDDWLDGCEVLIGNAGNHPETRGAVGGPTIVPTHYTKQ